jgi:tetratricopeptide (TPR) repeat protein
VACLTEQRWRAAVPLFNELIADGGADDWLLRDRRGWAHLRLRDWPRALDDFTAATRVRPEQAQSWARRAWVSGMLGRQDECRSAYARAVEFDPGEWWMWSDRADLEAAWGQYDAAAAGYAQVVKLAPDNPFGWHRLAVLSLARGQVDEYRATCARMRKALSGRLWNEDDRLAIAWMCALGPDAVADLDAVVALATQSVPPGSDSVNGLRTLGAILYRSGQFEKALAVLQEAASKPGGRDSPELALFLAMTYHRLGHRAEARTWLERVPPVLDQGTATLVEAATLATLHLGPAGALPAATAWQATQAVPPLSPQPRLVRRVLRNAAAALIRSP